MKHIALIAAGCLAATLPTAPTPADELNPRWVAPDAQWVVHVDVEALFGSPLGKLVLNEDLGLGVAQQRAEIQEHLGVDITKDILGLTAYGRADWGQDGAVVIATTTNAADDVLQALKEQGGEGYATRTLGDRVLHIFGEGEQRMYAFLGDRRNGRVIVLSANPEVVLETLGVMRDRNSRSTITPPDNAIIFATASDMDRLPEFDATSQILGKAQDVSLAISTGENDTIVTAIGLGTESDEQARNISAVVQGLLAAGRLMAGADKDMAFLDDLIGGINVNADGSSLKLSIKLSEDMLEELIGQVGEVNFDLDMDF